MAIYRGTGGAGDSTTDATVTEVTQQAEASQAYLLETATYKNDARKLAINFEDSEYTLEDGTTGYSALHYAAKAEDFKDAASTSATDAASSASSASTSAFNASNLATSAATSATNAATSETNAESSATTASTAATSASASADTATVQAIQAAGSASLASTAATNAQTAQTAAETAQTAAETALDALDDKYLGSKSSDPTVDNDGDALVDGALYFNTTDNVLKVYDLGTTTWLLTKSTTAQQTNIDTVAGISSNVTTVAGISSDVQTVADSNTAITSVADNILDIQNAEENASDAQKLAINPEDSFFTLSDGVTTGYSALHHAEKASDSAANAFTSATNASVSAANAASSATSASNSATSASSSATFAQSSKASAETSKNDAEKLAITPEDTQYTLDDGVTTGYSALHYAAKADTFRTLADNAASSASSDASSAATSASNAATSETNASNSASSASTSATAAESAKDAALAALDSFDDRYLGTKTSDPTLDNDGNALVAGALYFNTTDDVMKVYEGSTWVAAYASLSGALLVANNLSDLNDLGTARNNLGLGSAATTASTAYATAAQGTLADSAVQPGDNISDLNNDAGYVTTDTNTTYSAGTGLTLTGTTFSNSAPDQTVALTGSGATSVSGTYPNFTISSTDTNTTYSTATSGTLGLVKIGYTESGKNYPVELSNGQMYVNVPWTDTDTVYSLPEATSTTRGGIELFSNTDQSVAANAVTATTGRTYGIQLNSNGQAVVNVPWVNTDTNTTYSAGSGLTLTGTTFSNSAPDQTVSLTGSGATTVTGTYPNFTISSTDTNTNTTYSAGSGLDLSGTTFSVEPDLRDGITHVGLDSSDYISFTNNSRIDFFVNGGNRVRIESDGDLHADGDVIAYSTTISDERLKTNIVGIENAVAKVFQLNGYTFEYKADGKVSAGVIAQEVEAVLPEAVTEKLLPLKADDGQEYKVVNYDALHGLLIEAVKELSARVEALEAK
jgi:hypothetical protein